jgi:DNA (cytosine-5)-methyltransferase 1
MSTSKSTKPIKRKLNVLDLFSGCGGLSYGFEKAGYRILAGIDNWDISLKSFKRNHKEAKIFCGDIEKLPPSEIVNHFLKD